MTLRWVPGWNGLTEPEAVSYVAAVEAADGQDLEFGVARAINDFVVGCKNDGIWDAIKACCILAGARTLSGALVPLVGTAPTNYNFVAGDYNRETGLVGDGSTKYLDSNRANNADPQNNHSQGVYVNNTHFSATNLGVYIGTGGGFDAGATHQGVNPNLGNTVHRSRFGTTVVGRSGGQAFTGLFGMTRNSGSSFIYRVAGVSTTSSTASEPAASGNVYVYCRNVSNAVNFPSNGRLKFYWIGESLDLALLDTRVSNLMTAIGAAIP